MSNNATIARPYAKAAFAIAMQDKTIPAWSNFLDIAAALVQDLQITTLLKNPKITPIQRFECLADLCQKAIHPAAQNFLKLLALKDRLLLLPAIAKLFETLRIEQEKIANVEVTSALALNPAEQERLATALKIRLQREINLNYCIDPNLIGGIVIRAEDLVIDGSIRGKLARLANALAN